MRISLDNTDKTVIVTPMETNINQQQTLNTMIPDLNKQRWLTAAELASVFQVHPETVRRWRQGGAPCVLLNVAMEAKHAKARFNLDEIEKWLREGKKHDKARKKK